MGLINQQLARVGTILLCLYSERVDFYSLFYQLLIGVTWPKQLIRQYADQFETMVCATPCTMHNVRATSQHWQFATLWPTQCDWLTGWQWDNHLRRQKTLLLPSNWLRHTHIRWQHEKRPSRLSHRHCHRSYALHRVFGLFWRFG